MKKLISKKSLTKKVLFSLMAASMMGVSATAFADYSTSETIDGSLQISPGNNAYSYLGNVTVNVNEKYCDLDDGEDPALFGIVADDA